MRYNKNWPTGLQSACLGRVAALSRVPQSTDLQKPAFALSEVGSG
ncbi:hypothetical protein RHOER0001_4562 [Rhodococcus erythropolis SK121]|nr:hypothetical protein RHOER0001_4562 [Rhodococcus erythropolis SK121]